MKKNILLTTVTGILVVGLSFGAGYLGSFMGKNTPASLGEERTAAKPELTEEAAETEPEEAEKQKKVIVPAKSTTTNNKSVAQTAESEKDNGEVSAADETKKQPTGKVSSEKAVSAKKSEPETKPGTEASAPMAEAPAPADTPAVQPYNPGSTDKNQQGLPILYDDGKGNQVVQLPDGGVGVTTGTHAEASNEALDKRAELDPANQKAAEVQRKHDEEVKKQQEEFERKKAEEEVIRF